MSKVIYEMVTARIVELLENGVVPWRRPWRSGAAVNWTTQKPYRGVNQLLLDAGEYATAKKIFEAGGSIKKDQKGQFVIFWRWIEAEDEETGELKKIPLLRYYKVFNIQTQCEGLKSKRNDEIFEHDPIEEAEAVVLGYEDKPTLTTAPGRAFYRPSQDRVSVPPLEDYKVPEEYYCTLFHELVHSTGHSKRLNRNGITDELVAFGDDVYSEEELVAEIGAAMLCGVTGIDNTTIENSASYINGWLRVLKDDKKLITTAAAKAQKAADFILGMKFEEEAEVQ